VDGFILGPGWRIFRPAVREFDARFASSLFQEQIHATACIALESFLIAEWQMIAGEHVPYDSCTP
jgi:hypothetical protein